MPPSETELLNLAERALRRAGPEAQVTASWERSLVVDAPPERRLRHTDALVVEVVVVREGCVGRASTTATDDDGLRRVAEGAARAAELGAGDAAPRRVRAATMAAEEGDSVEGIRRAAHDEVRAVELATEDEPGRAGAERAGRDAGRPGEPEPPADVAPRLPDPLRGRSHDGWDAAVLALDPADVAARLPHPDGAFSVRWAAGAARTAIASSRGVRAAEQRTHARIDVTSRRDDRVVSGGAAAVGDAGLDAEALLTDVAELLGDGEPVSVQPGEHPAVLGHHAVAQVLELVKPHFGVLAAAGQGGIAGRLGKRIVAPCINLSDSPRFASTLPRSYDVEGVPRQPVPLLQDGVAHRVVHDTASAARAGTTSTGHASVPARLAPRPDHLVLVGGGASDHRELAAPIERGLYIPALARAAERGSGEPAFRTQGAFVIEDGELGAPARDLRVTFDPFDVLAATEALTGRQRLVPGATASARLLGATVCPALRASGGLRVLRLA